MTGKRQPEIFWRTAGSGAKATQDKKKGKDPGKHEGDLTSIDPRGNFLTDNCFIELKHFKDFRLDELVLKRGKLHKAWVKCVEQAMFNKFPILIIKKSFGEIYVVTDALFNNRILQGKAIAIIDAEYLDYVACVYLIADFVCYNPKVIEKRLLKWNGHT